MTCSLRPLQKALSFRASWARCRRPRSRTKIPKLLEPKGHPDGGQEKLALCPKSPVSLALLLGTVLALAFRAAGFSILPRRPSYYSFSNRSTVTRTRPKSVYAGSPGIPKWCSALAIPQVVAVQENEVLLRGAYVHLPLRLESLATLHRQLRSIGLPVYTCP